MNSPEIYFKKTPTSELKRRLLALEFTAGQIRAELAKREHKKMLEKYKRRPDERN